MTGLPLALLLQAGSALAPSDAWLDTAQRSPQQVVVEGDERTTTGWRHWAPLAGLALVDIPSERFRARFSDVRGRQFSVGVEYRWEDTRPLALLSLEAARPFGLAATLRIDALTGAATYDVGDGAGRFRLESSGLDVRMRGDVDARTVGEAHVRYRSRRVRTDRLDTPSGSLLGLGVGLERRLVASPRHSVDARIRVFQSSGLAFTRGSATIRGRTWLAPRDGAALAPSVLAAQMTFGLASRGTPADEMFLAASSGVLDLPLRGHRSSTGGVLGGAPISRSVALLNVEWRHRLVRARTFQVGVAAFYDGGRFGHALQATPRTLFHDVGVGLRFGIGSRTVLRADVGRSLVDGKNSLTVGVGEAF